MMLRFVNRLPFKLDEYVDRDLIDEEEYDDIIDEVFQFDPKELVEKVAAGNTNCWEKLKINRLTWASQFLKIIQMKS